MNVNLIDQEVKALVLHSHMDNMKWKYVSRNISNGMLSKQIFEMLINNIFWLYYTDI